MHFWISQLYDDDVATLVQCKVKLALIDLFDEYKKLIEHTSANIISFDSGQLVKTQ